MNYKLPCSLHKKKVAWIFQGTFHSKHFLQCVVTATNVVYPGITVEIVYSSGPDTKANLTVLVPVSTIRELNHAKAGCIRKYFSVKAVLRNSCLLFQLTFLLPLLLPTYQ